MQRTTNSRSKGVRPIVEADKQTLAESIATYYASDVVDRGMSIDYEAAKASIKSAVSWAAQSAKPWLFLSGNVGTGKTTLMKALRRTLNDLLIPCKMFRASDFPTLFLDNAELTERQILGGEWCRVLLLDDIGVEQYEYKEYGNVIRPFVKIVEERYNRRLPMVVSTNLSGEEIRTIYGERTIDRIKEMSVGIRYEGKSYRK